MQLTFDNIYVEDYKKFGIEVTYELEADEELILDRAESFSRVKRWMDDADDLVEYGTIELAKQSTDEEGSDGDEASDGADAPEADDGDAAEFTLEDTI